MDKESNKSHSLSRISIQAEGLVHSINMYLAYSSKCDIRPQDMDLGTRKKGFRSIEKDQTLCVQNTFWIFGCVTFIKSHWPRKPSGQAQCHCGREPSKGADTERHMQSEGDFLGESNGWHFTF